MTSVTEGGKNSEKKRGGRRGIKEKRLTANLRGASTSSTGKRVPTRTPKSQKFGREKLFRCVSGAPVERRELH